MRGFLWVTSVVAALALDLDADDECLSEGNGCSLEAVQLRATKDAEDLEEIEAPGLVYSLYTFGAVATAKVPLQDLSQPSGSFRGLRCYTETILPASRQTDIAAIFKTFFYHAQMPTLALHWHKDSEYYPGPGRPELPQHTEGRAGDVSLHNMKHYIDRLKGLQLNGKNASGQYPFSMGLKLAFLSWGAYEKNKYWRSNVEVAMEDLIAHHLPQWKLVAHTQQDTLEAVDNIFITQNQETLDCVLAFEGTHTFNEFFRNLDGASKEGYCGFPQVHKGYADKLYWLMTGSMPKLRPTLEKCNKVSCTGHSLGGSLCEVFAACANSGRTSDKHYKLQQFKKGTPTLLPEIKQQDLSRHFG